MSAPFPSRLLAAALAAAATGGLVGWSAVAPPSSVASGGGPVLVVVAHPDDEALGFAGIIESALGAGRTVYVAVATNGDAPVSGGDSAYCGAPTGTPATTAHRGLTRDGETVSGMGVLGLTRTNDPQTTRILFLGYPDGALATIEGAQTPWTGDATTLHHTYAEDGDGSIASCNGDLHFEQTGTHAQLSAADLNGDFDRLVALTAPVDVYTHSANDGHPDHRAVNRLVLAALGRAGLTPVVHATLIHPEGAGSCMAQSAYLWPNPSDPAKTAPFSRFTPGLDVTPPPTPVCSSTPTGSSWGTAGAPDELVAVPADMQATTTGANRKWQVISRYSSQIDCTRYADGTYPPSCGYMYAFVKAHEFFWRTGGGTASPPVSTAPPTVSGVPVVGQPLSASTGTWSGSPTSYAYEWRRCDGSGAACTAIAAAAAAVYTPVTADVGSTLRVAVTAANGAGSTTAVSAPTAPVAAAATEGTLGRTSVGSLVDAGAAGYLDVSGPYALSQAVSVVRLNAYVAGGTSTSKVRGIVYRDNGGSPGDLVAVTPEVATAAGAAPAWVPLAFSSPVSLPAGSYWLGYWYADGNGRRYYVGQAGAERYARAAYSAAGAPPSTFGAASGSSSSYSLYATWGGSLSVPVNTAPPAIAGSAAAGQTLTATTGTWDGAPTAYAYEWRRCDSGGGGCVAIGGATASSYLLASVDVGHAIRVAVTATNAAGSTVAVSAPTAAVVAAGGEGSFGQSTVGTLVDRGAAGYLDVSGPYTLSASVQVTRLDAYVAGGANVSRVRGVVYFDSGGQPGQLVAVTSEATTAAGVAAAWQSLPFASAVSLAPGSYWLGYWYADGNGPRYYVGVSGSERYRGAVYSATADPPATFGTARTSSSSYSLVAVYATP